MTILTVKEAAKLLRVSRSWLDRHIGEIPHFRVSRVIRFREEQLLEWIESREEGGKPMHGKSEIQGE